MEILIIFAIGFASSVFGSFTSGGATLLAFTLLGAYGLSPFLALGVFKVGSLGLQLGGLYNYAKADKIVWDRVLFMTVVGVVGAYIGASLIVSIDEALYSKIIGFALLLCLPLTFFKPSLGVVSEKTSKTKEYIGHVMYFLNTIWAYSIVFGAGVISFYSQAYFYGMTLLEIRGTSKIPILIKGVVALIVYVQAGIVDWKLGGIFFVGALLGSLIGTHYSIKIGDTWLRYILLVTVLSMSLKLIFGL